MNTLFGWMKSTRSMLAVMAMILLFIVVIGSMVSGQLTDQVLTLVSMTVGAVITAYFGKRDNPEDLNK